LASTVSSIWTESRSCPRGDPCAAHRRYARIVWSWAVPFAAARPFAAHVEALFVNPDPVDSMPYYGEGLSSAVVQENHRRFSPSCQQGVAIARGTLAEAASAAGATVLGTPAAGTDYGILRGSPGQFRRPDRNRRAFERSRSICPLKEDDRPGLAEAFESTLIDTASLFCLPHNG